MIKRIGIVLAVLVCITGASLYWLLAGVRVESQPFDSLTWKQLYETSQLNDPGCVRGGMALNLIDSGALVGAPREKVLFALGEPDSSQHHLLTFGLGQCHWDWRHSELVVWLNDEGLVQSTKIRSLN
jgi:hypothetical protein